LKELILRIAILSAAAGLMIMSGCSIKKPEAPSWETTWDLPLVNKSYALSDILEQVDDSLINLDSLGNPYFEINENLDTVLVEDNLRARGKSTQYIQRLGTVSIDPPDAQGITLTKASFGLPPEVPWVPAASFDHFESLQPLTGFSWALIQNGQMDLTISNDLGVDLDTLVVTLYNQGYLSTPLGIANFESGLSQGESATRTFDLSGDSVTNNLVYKMHGAVPASFVAGGTDTMLTTCSFPANFVISAGQAEVPDLSRDLGQTFTFDDSSLIASAVIDSGYFDVQVTNGMTIPMDIILRVPNFIRAGDTLTVLQHLPASGTISRQVNLEGYTFRPDGLSKPQSMQINAAALIEASTPDERVFKESDSLQVLVNLSTIVLNSVSGQVKPTAIDIDTIYSDVDIPDEINDAQLTHASLNLTLYNNSTADADVNLTIFNESLTKSLGLAGRVNGKLNRLDPPRATILTLGSEELAAFLNPPPERIAIVGQAIFNPEGEIVTITRNDYFFGEVKISSPLAFSLNDTIKVNLDINESDINQGDIPDLEKTFGYGKISATLSNRLPVGASVSLYISTRSDSTIFDDPNALVIGPFTLSSAAVDNDGYAIGPVTSTFEDSLDSHEILIFDNDKVYIAPKVVLMPTGIGGSYIQGSDYMGIQATARIKINAGDNLWDDDK
jgi:hypothetical protein